MSNAALSDAASVDAERFAPGELQSARRELDQANKAMAGEDFETARLLANAAETDAALARAKAGSGKAQIAANAIQESIRTLREELTRTQQ